MVSLSLAAVGFSLGFAAVVSLGFAAVVSLGFAAVSLARLRGDDVFAFFASQFHRLQLAAWG